MAILDADAPLPYAAPKAELHAAVEHGLIFNRFITSELECKGASGFFLDDLYQKP